MDVSYIEIEKPHSFGISDRKSSLKAKIRVIMLIYELQDCIKDMKLIYFSSIPFRVGAHTHTKKNNKSKYFGGGNFLGINKLHRHVLGFQIFYNLVSALSMHLKCSQWQYEPHKKLENVICLSNLSRKIL